MSATPQAVAATLRRADIMTVTGSREGVKVSRSYGGTASVSVDITGRNARRVLVGAVTEALEAAGYTVEPNPNDGAILTVLR